MEKNPDQVAALRNAHLKSIAYIENNPQDAITIGVTFTGMEKRAVVLALQNIDYDHIITTSPALEYIDFLNKLGYTTITQPQSFFQSLTID
jgi:ABC-type nitrate/sulfonate/bicarbonate transport system substrate-binding protein